MTLNVQVTQEDIDKGKRNACQLCPIARAIKRQGGTGVVVDLEISFKYGGRLFVASPPKSALDFINDFDGKKAVQPFEFSLDLRPRNYIA